MNKLLFNEGGQPVYLDDLKLLQENGINVLGTLINALCGNEEVMLVNDVAYNTDISQGQVNKKFVIDGGLVYVRGVALSYEGITASSQSSVWLCLKQSSSNKRTFEDGQERYCQEETTAYLSEDNSGATESYKLFELPVLKEKLYQAVVEGTDIAYTTVADSDIRWYNGFSGEIKYKRIPGGYRVSINASSSQKDWGEENPRLVAEVGHELFDGGVSPIFFGGGKDGYTDTPWFAHFVYEQLYVEGLRDANGGAMYLPYVKIAFDVLK